MLSIEHYDNLMNHVASALGKLESIMKKECVVNDVEVMDLVIGSKEDLVVLQDILNFLLVKKIDNNKLL
jgi:hypothetical protein